MKYCCEDLPFRLRGNPKKGMSKIVDFYDSRTRGSIVWYLTKTREYLVVHNTKCASEMKYCFICGAKLPESLEEAWLEVLEKECGITDPLDEERDMVPPEFWTDEWWKKRGL